MDKRKVTALPNRERDENAATLERAKRAMASPDKMREAAELAASARKIHYDALRQAGFNEYQALVIVAKMF